LNALRRINLSAAIIVLVCFFLPWVQVSCAGAQDTLSGFDLARNDHALLWLIPVLMAALLLLALARGWKASPKAYSIASAICGGIVAYLINRERLRVNDESGLISAQLTGWFWLGLFSALCVTVTGLLGLFRRKQSPQSQL
jgi:hypothetical protein